MNAMLRGAAVLRWALALSSCAAFPAFATFGPDTLTLEFAQQSVHTASFAKTVNLVNPGPGSVTVNSITYQFGTNADEYPIAQGCMTIAAGTSCPIAVTFIPSAPGFQRALLAIDTSAGGFVVDLRGVGESSLVVHYYQAVLRRDPDGGGKAFWDSESGRMRALGADAREVSYAMAMSFFFSSEYIALQRNPTEFLRDLYATFLNRAPDAGGLSFWAGQLAAGMPPEVVIASFMFSQEFVAFTQGIFGDSTVRSETDTTVDFYRGLLARLPDDGGFAYWLRRFRIAQCGGQAAVLAQVEAISQGFASSDEYSFRNRSNGQFVGDMYNAFLRRGGDLGGVLFWINQLATGARSRDHVRRDFLASPEFNTRVAAMIADGCVDGTCSVELAPANGASFTYNGGTSAFEVTTDAGCTWTVDTASPWLHVLSGNPGNGYGIVQYSVDPYPVLAGGTRLGSFSVPTVSHPLQKFIQIRENGIPTTPPPIVNPCYPNCQSNGYCCAPGLVGCQGRCYVSNTAAVTATHNNSCLSVTTICSQ